MIRKIVKIKAMGDFTLECEMESGEVYRYDMSFINKEDGEMIEPLRNIEVFKGVWLDEIGALEWPNGYGIHGNTVVRDGVLISKKAA